MKYAGNVVVEGSNALKETLGAFMKIADSVEGFTKNAMDVASASLDQISKVIVNVSTIAESISREMTQFKV